MMRHFVLVVCFGLLFSAISANLIRRSSNGALNGDEENLADGNDVDDVLMYRLDRREEDDGGDDREQMVDVKGNNLIDFQSHENAVDGTADLSVSTDRTDHSGRVIGDDDWQDAITYDTDETTTPADVCGIPCSKKGRFYCQSERCDGHYKCGEAGDDEHNCPEKCNGPVYDEAASIHCKAAISRFYYNKATKNCTEFTFGGCSKVANMFASFDECMYECSGTLTTTTATPGLQQSTTTTTLNPQTKLATTLKAPSFVEH